MGEGRKEVMSVDGNSLGNSHTHTQEFFVDSEKSERRGEAESLFSLKKDSLEEGEGRGGSTYVPRTQ